MHMCIYTYVCVYILAIKMELKQSQIWWDGVFLPPVQIIISLLPTEITPGLERGNF